MGKSGTLKLDQAAGSVRVTNLKMRNRRIMHAFFITAVVYMTIVVFVGFWPSYFGQLFTDMPDRHWVIHLHAVVFTGWLLLLLAQVVLVAAGNTKFHRKLGIAGGMYGILILVLGVSAAFVLPLGKMADGQWTMDEAASFLILPLGDMLIFSGLFGAALYYRKKSDIHKRLILAASVMLVFPAAARIFGEADIPLLMLLWLAPMVAGMILDGILHRKVHPAYLAGFAVLLLSVGRAVIMYTEPWQDFAAWLLGLFM
jgi:hypothetical protein